MQIKRSASAKPFPPRDSVEPAIKVCPPDQLQEWVEELAEPRHFVAQPEANRRAAGWIGRCLEFWGYRVTYQGPWRNVVALPAGGDGPWTLVCSHYDTVATTPGADDNASAVAVMLGCALALSRFSPRPAVGFVSFNREEDGLLGSADFVENAGIKVSKAHVLEMVGYASHERGSQTVPQGLPIKMPDAGDFLGLLANRDSGPLLDHVLRSARTHVPDFPVLGLQVWLGLERHFPVLLRSDHAPFWKARIPALMWTDTSEFRNPNYHRDSDTPATLDYRFMATVTELLVHTLIADALND